jgi:hypothetical protein
MPDTFELIASSTVGAGGAANISFTSIPSTYTDLCLNFSLRSSDGSDYISLKFNTSSSTFTGRFLTGNGAGAGSTSRSDNLYTGTIVPTASTASTFSNGFLYVPRYAGSANKSFSIDSVLENNATSAEMRLATGLWSTTSVITQIDLAHPTANFVQYSTAYLYGIKNS